MSYIIHIGDIDMKDLDGFYNEYVFVKNLNGKSIKELNPLLRELIHYLFYDIKDTDLVKCWRNHYPQKADILIKVNNHIKGVSIKRGMKNSLHVDCISEFIHFLIENKVPRDIIIKYLKYHYADGTTNGKGKIRLSVEEYKKTHQRDIDKINRVFNQEELLRKAIERFVIKGNNSKYYIDALIHGEVEDFLWLSTESIVSIILSKKNDYSSAVHFGPLVCQPQSRCLNHNPLYEKDRFKVQIKWYSLNDDIIEYMNNEVVYMVESLEHLEYMLSN